MNKDGKPLQATAGGEHSLILDKLGSIYSAGACGAGWNRCKELSEDLFGWRPVPIPEKIVQLKAGYYHNLALAQSGSVYSWGCGTFVDGNNDGVIPALGNSKSDLGSSPEILKGLDSVDSVDSGAYHSVLLTKSNRVLTLGSAQLGQLGRDTDGSELDASNLPVDSIPREVQGIPTGERINSIGAGFYNTFAACKSGALFCSGENQNQQCGASSSNIMKMTRIQELKDKLILHATGGYCHTMVLTDDGEVFTLGCAVDGQRGDGREVEDPSRPIVTPIHLPTKQKVLQMAAGANHSMIIGEGNSYGSIFLVDIYI
jgi:alpha-tubulin suppressor-like RCC1 family protein